MGDGRWVGGGEKWRVVCPICNADEMSRVCTYLWVRGIVHVLRLSKYRNGVSGSPHRASKFGVAGAVMLVGRRLYLLWVRADLYEVRRRRD